MQISKTEHETYETLKKSTLVVFTPQDVSLLLGFSKTKTYNIIKALKKKGCIETISSGRYCFSDANEFLVGSYFNHPSYVSFLSALNYYGFSDNLPKKLTFVSRKYKNHARFQYVCLSQKRFFGYRKEGDIIIADKEKVFIDSLLFPKYAGGIKEISRLLRNHLDELNIDKLISYALQVQSKMVARRLGFILNERLHTKQKKKLLQRIGNGVGFLDPNIKMQKDLNNEWLLYTRVE
ncbi:MAG: type IV toxin-antitoxin system AbiEi family antitoxin domain-containing protein [Candidatus Woesearchaeota archaeon]